MTEDPSEPAMPPPEVYGDPESLFRAAYDDMVRTAYRLLGNRDDAEDAAQNSFHKLMMAWPRVGLLPTAGEQRAYLIKIAMNEALQILRYPHRKWERPNDYSVEPGSVPESLDESVQAREFLRLVWKAISELPRTRREVVILRAAGYEYKEIAATLGISLSTVRSHISDARRQLSRAVPRDLKGEQE